MSDTPFRLDGDEPTFPDSDWYAIVDYITGEASPDDHAAIERRLAEDPAFAAFAAPLIRMWQIRPPRPKRDLKAHWAMIEQKVADQYAADQATSQSSTPHAPVRRHLSLHPPHLHARTWETLAAVLLIAFVMGRHAYKEQSHFYYKAGTKDTTVTLPDGSVATLAPDSYLGTEAGFPTRNRELYLVGEAHFVVAPNPRVPFLVHAIGVGTRVLGTTFRIHTDTTPQIRVNVEQGRVALETRDAHGHWQQIDILTAGQATQVTLIQAWLAQVGYDVAGAGVPLMEASRICNALRRAALQTRAAAVTRP